jgi:hypothetical protein
MEPVRDLLAAAVDLQSETVALRRRLHRRPEVGLTLPETQATVLEAIDGLPLRVTTGTAVTSVVGVLEGGRPGPTVLLRGDMDALPMPEDTGLDFASEAPAATTPTSPCWSARPGCSRPGRTSWPAGWCSCGSRARRASAAPR